MVQEDSCYPEKVNIRVKDDYFWERTGPDFIQPM